MGFGNYKGVLDFQLFLLKEYGMPQKPVPLRSKETVAKFFNGTDKWHLNDLLCAEIVDDRAEADIDPVVLPNFAGVNFKNNQISIYGVGESDIGDSTILTFVPEKLEIIIDSDPRKSYAVLLPDKKHNMTVQEPRGMEYSYRMNGVLFYPQKSKLMSNVHKAEILNAYGWSSAEPSYMNPIPFDDSNEEWFKAIEERVQTGVLDRLKKHYSGARILPAKISDLASVDLDKREECIADNPVIYFRLIRSKGMKEENVKSLTLKLLHEVLPFPMQIWPPLEDAEWKNMRGQERPKSKEMYFSVLLG